MINDEIQDTIDNSYPDEYDAPEFEDGDTDYDYYETDPDDYSDYSSEDAELYIGITAQSKRQF